MKPAHPFHPGELAVQARAGEVQIARRNGGALSDQIPKGALPFITQQPMVVVASVAQDQSVWASLLVGEPGFLRAEDPSTLFLDTTAPRSVSDDPLWQNHRTNPQIGLLIIELGSRRRLRVNGRVRSSSDKGLRIDVDTAYPNCPKYIQRRHWRITSPATGGVEETHRSGSTLTPGLQHWIRQADTLFVASAHPEQGADASHRGGKPGFVQILNPQRLRIPDYAGNSMFNTFGNFLSYPYAGLAFIDFERSRLLQLTGRPVIRWDLADAEGRTGGTGRYWDFQITAWRESSLAFRLEWEFLDFSPFIPEQKPATDQMVLQIAEIHRESDRVKRFRLRAFDDLELPAFTAGAHLPVTLELATGERLLRHYSILSSPEVRHYYDIGVLDPVQSRGGSRYLHTEARRGDQLTTGRPNNLFPLADSARHSILIAGGIGITPILSMLRVLHHRGQSYELHYSARHWSDLAFRAVIGQLAGDRASFYASRETESRPIDLQQVLANPAPGVHIYVCGPHRLINSVRDIAVHNGWPAEQIHYESFGITPDVGDASISVTLARSGRILQVPATQSILDTLLETGYPVAHDCKRGECSLCATRVLEGEPDHRDLCLGPEERKEMMCLCVSRTRGGGLTLDL